MFIRVIRLLSAIGLGVLGQFEIRFYGHNIFYIIVIYFRSYVKPGKFRVIGSLLNTFLLDIDLGLFQM